jgi:hypothetical protein
LANENNTNQNQDSSKNLQLNEFQENPLWSEPITKKAKYFKTLLPLLDVERIQFRDEKGELFSHYPRIEILLNIIEIIIGRTSIVLSSPYTGITKDEVFNEARGSLRRIDRYFKKTLSKTDHIEFLNRIWDCLVPPTKKKHCNEGIDYSKTPFESYKESFCFLQTDLTPDNKILYTIDPILINIHAKILEIKLEAQRDALNYIIDNKIIEGKYREAIQIAQADYELSIQKLMELVQIKNKIERSLDPLLIYDQYSEVLESSRKHINQTRDKNQNQIQKLQQILLQIQNFHTELETDVFQLNEIIGKSLQKSIVMMNLIKTTRERFLDQQVDIFNVLKNKIDYSKLSKITTDILLCDKTSKDEIMSHLLPYFCLPKIPHVNTVSQIITIKIKGIKIQEKHTEKRALSKRPQHRKDCHTSMYPKELQELAYQKLEQLILPNQNTTTQVIFSALDDQKTGFLIQDFIRILIQIQFAFPHIVIGNKAHPIRLDIDCDISRFKSQFFIGTNLIIKKKEASEKI